MTLKLFAAAITKFALGAVLVGTLLFGAAGSLYYENGWIFMGLLFIPMFFAGLVMMVKAPDLLRSRLDAKEKLGAQKQVIAFSGLMFITVFLLCGFTFRFGWYTLPGWAVAAASVVFLIAYLLYGEVLRENAYLSRTIEVQEGQKVVDTGLYGIVRHPMYVVTLLLFLSMPLVLGSIFGFVVIAAVYPALLVKRIQNEEQFLEKELAGYIDYKKKVKYRLLPFIW